MPGPSVGGTGKRASRSILSSALPLLLGVLLAVPIGLMPDWSRAHSATHAPPYGRGAASTEAIQTSEASASLAKGLGPNLGGSPLCGGPAAPTPVCSSIGGRGGPPGTVIARWGQQVNWPADRTSAAMAYDPLDQEVVLFGDSTGAGYGTFRGLNDTWTFRNGTWSELRPPGAPPSVDGVQSPYALVYSPADRAVLAVGPDVRNQTYEFRAASWTHLHPAVAPSTRTGFGLAYDPSSNAVILFGGQVNSVTCSPHRGSPYTALVCGDTWRFGGGNWTKLAPAQAPAPRLAALMSANPLNSSMLLFGGTTYKNRWLQLNDTWEFKGGNWTAVTTTSAPPFGTIRGYPIEYSGLTYDGDTHYVILAGENGANASWAYRHGVWSAIPNGSAIPSSSSSTPVYYPPARAVISLDFTGPYGSVTWSFHPGTRCAPPSSANQSWCTELPPRALGLTPAYMVYDGADHYVLLLVPRAYPNHLWRYELWAFANGTWSHLPVSPKAGPRAAGGVSVTYDARDHYVLLFGGNYGFYSHNDLRQAWTYRHGNWTHLAIPSGALWPSPRDSAAMVYDSRGRSVILFGGELYNQTQLNDTWMFSNGSWSRVGLASGPTPRVRYGITYDSSDGSIVLFGGSNYATSKLLNDTWTFSGRRWTNVTSSAGPAPSARAWPLMSDLPRLRGAVLFGGSDYQWPNPHRSTTTWLFSAGVWQSLTTVAAHDPNPIDANWGLLTYDPALGGALLFEIGLASGTDGGVWVLR